MTVVEGGEARAGAPGARPPVDPARLGAWTAGLQNVLLAGALAMLVADGWRFALTGGEPEKATLESRPEYGLSLMACGATSLVYVVLILAVGVMSLVWIRRTNGNAQAWSRTMRVTPGWAVGWFFVPIMGLWKPFQGVADTWRASEGAADDAPRATPGILRLWWGLFIVANLLGRAVAHAEDAASTPVQEHGAALLSALYDGMEAALALTFREVVRRITALQAMRLVETPAPRGDLGPLRA